MHGVDRRTFLRSAGVTAVLGAVGAKGVLADEVAGVEQGAALAAQVPTAATRQVFDFDTVYSRIGTDSTKWDGAIADFGEGVQVGMGVADMDFRAAPCITNAIAQRCQHENWGYQRLRPSYTQAIVDWNRRRYGLEIEPSTLTLSTGVHPALIAALQAFVPPGGRVLLTSPTYNGFYGDLRFTSTIAEDSPMTVVEGRYSIDFDDFERRAQRSSAFILCNPQNPTGNFWTPEELTRLGEICLRRRVVVLADEIHCDFVMKGQKYTPFASLPNREIVDNSLTFKAASKTFSLAGMKQAWFFSTNRDYLERVRARNRVDQNTIGAVANEAALREGEPWIDQLLPYLDANHDLVESFIRANLPLIKYRKAQGTYLAWLDVSQLAEAVGAKETAAAESRTSAQPVTPEMIVQRWLARNAGVFVNPGHTYGTGGENHVRMNLGTSRTLIRQALENIAAASRRI
jgi:cystathionine beta-lyase